MTATIGRGGLEIRMLDDSDEKEVGIVDVQSVDIGETAIQFQDNAKVGEITDASQALDIGARRVRRDGIGDASAISRIDAGQAAQRCVAVRSLPTPAHDLKLIETGQGGGGQGVLWSVAIDFMG